MENFIVTEEKNTIRVCVGENLGDELLESIDRTVRNLPAFAQGAGLLFDCTEVREFSATAAKVIKLASRGRLDRNRIAIAAIQPKMFESAKIYETLTDVFESGRVRVFKDTASAEEWLDSSQQ